jgi:hypothetical protein
MLQQGGGERRIAAGAVERHIVGLRRIDDQRTLSRRVDPAQPARRRPAPMAQRFGERIGAASVENDDVDSPA